MSEHEDPDRDQPRGPVASADPSDPWRSPSGEQGDAPAYVPGPLPVVPYGTPHRSPTAGAATTRFPGWAWPVMTAVALVVGAVGGVFAGVLVSLSMSSATVNVAPLSTDTAASTPLRADNSSIAAVAAKVLPSTVQILANGGAAGSSSRGATGSGFVLDSTGHIVTNNHVVADATGQGELQVVDQDGARFNAEIVGRSPVYDLAVLQVTRPSHFRPVSLGSAGRLRVGDTVVAIGSPLGLSSTVTSGIVSATHRPVTTGDVDGSSYIDALQTDAAINPGNSGGPLVDLRGEVVGVNSAIATTGGTVGGQSGNIGVGFAIPMEQVRVTAAQILATGRARYPVIGASVQTGTASDGAHVSAVPSGTPAAAAGLRTGDVVTGVDGEQVTDGIGLIVAIRSHQPGERVHLTVVRDGHRRDVAVRLQGKVG